MKAPDRANIAVDRDTHRVLCLLSAGTRIPMGTLVADAVALLLKERRKRKLWVPEGEMK